MDTDVMVLKNLDQFLVHDAFSGFESVSNVPTGIMGAKKGHLLIGELLSFYDTAKFIRSDGSYNMTTNIEIITTLLKKRGLIPNGEFQIVEQMAFYPQNVFCPDTSRLDDLEYINETATIHYFAGSWKSQERKNEKNLYGISTWFRFIDCS